MTKQYQDEMCDRLSRRSNMSRKSLKSNSALGAAIVKTKSKGRLGRQTKRPATSKSKRTLVKTPSVQDHTFHISRTKQSAQKQACLSALARSQLQTSKDRNQNMTFLSSADMKSAERMINQPLSSFSHQLNDASFKSHQKKNQSSTKKHSMLIQQNDKKSTLAIDAESRGRRDYSRTSKKSNRSISQEYLLRTSKKKNKDGEQMVMSHSILSNHLLLENANNLNHSSGRIHDLAKGLNIFSRDDAGLNATQTSNQKDPFLNHVLK